MSNHHRVVTHIVWAIGGAVLAGGAIVFLVLLFTLLGTIIAGLTH